DNTAALHRQPPPRISLTSREAPTITRLRPPVNLPPECPFPGRRNPTTGQNAAPAPLPRSPQPPPSAPHPPRAPNGPVLSFSSGAGSSCSRSAACGAPRLRPHIRSQETTPLDIPRATPRSKNRRWILGGAALGAVLLMTVAVSRIEPAAPSVESAGGRVATVEPGTRLRQVRRPGT